MCNHWTDHWWGILLDPYNFTFKVSCNPLDSLFVAGGQNGDYEYSIKSEVLNLSGLPSCSQPAELGGSKDERIVKTGIVGIESG